MTSVTDALPEAHRFVTGRPRIDAGVVNRHFVACRTPTSTRTVPPLAGSDEGEALKRVMFTDAAAPAGAASASTSAATTGVPTRLMLPRVHPLSREERTLPAAWI